MNLSDIKLRLEKASPGPWERRESAVYVEQEWMYELFQDDVNQGGTFFYNPTCGLELIFKNRVFEDFKSWGKAQKIANADFIAHAPSDISALVTEVERLREDMGALSQPFSDPEVEVMVSLQRQKIEAQAGEINRLREAMKQAEAQMRLKGKTNTDTIELKTLSDALDLEGRGL